jgi:hypothetical protein
VRIGTAGGYQPADQDHLDQPGPAGGDRDGGGQPGEGEHGQDLGPALSLVLPWPDSVSAGLSAPPSPIWPPPWASEPQLDLNDPANQHILVDAALATLQLSQPSPDGRPVPTADIGPHAEHS